MKSTEREFVVDGETFLVRLGEDGGFDCFWLTGSNPGYGFGSGAAAGYTMRNESTPSALALEIPAAPAPDDRVIDSIRVFLSMIYPESGFIGD